MAYAAGTPKAQVAPWRLLEEQAVFKKMKANISTHLWRFKVWSPPVTNAVINHPVLLDTILTAQDLSNTATVKTLNTTSKTVEMHSGSMKTCCNKGMM